MNLYTAAALVNRQADHLVIVNEIEDVAAEFAPDLQTVIATEPVIGWAPYSLLVDAIDSFGETRSYLVEPASPLDIWEAAQDRWLHEQEVNR